MLEEKIKQAYERWLAQPNMPADLAEEPKIKVYLSAVAPTEEAADVLNETLGKAAADLLKA